MDCEVAREALSARIDGEREPIPGSRVDEHLGGCEPCRQWYAAAVAQTQMLRRLAGRSQVAAVAAGPGASRWRGALTRPATVSWRRWLLAAVGVTQLGLAGAQALGWDLGAPHTTDEHVLNESTAWSAALGAVMLAAAIRPAVAAGLAGVLIVFVVVLAGYAVGDLMSAAVTPGRILSHLPAVAGAVLAVLVWLRDRPPGPESGVPSADIVLPDNATRGRRRSHLRPTDGSAA